MLVGFYKQAFKSLEAIDIQRIGGEFIETPNYTHTSPVKEGRWTIIGSRPDLLAATTIPELRASYDIFYKDTAVRHVSLDEFRNYPELRVAGAAFVENRLRVVLE